MIRFDDNTKLKAKDTFGFDGAMVDLTLVKSRTNKAGQFATLVFNQSTGFDPELSLFVMLKEAGRINGAGASFYIGERNDIKFSQRQFKEKLAENPELQEIFMNEVMDVLKGMLAQEETPEEIETPEANVLDRIMMNINSTNTAA